VLKQIKNSIATGLLLIIILSGSGITVVTHYCSGSKTTTHQVLRELTGKHNVCGGMSCKVSLKNSTQFSERTIGKSPCCKENSAFYKVATVDCPSVNKYIPIIPAIEHLFSIPLGLLQITPEYNDLAHLLFRCSSPPLSGMQLVVFLQQMRLPAPACLS
jgi:hypothetical protein